jgi:hypothetical protein
MRPKDEERDPVEAQEGYSWASVHICPRCEHVTNLAELDLLAVTTGITSCPRCDWSGQIKIQIVDSLTHKKADPID